MLVGLVGGADGVIHEGRRRLFDVTAYDVSDGAGRGELDEAARAGFVGGKIGDVQAAGVEVIAGMQDSSLAIVVGDVSGLMAGNGEHIDHAAAEIDAAGLLGPRGDAEGLLRGLDGGGDQRGVGESVEGLVAGGVVAMRVGVSDDEGDGLALIALQPAGDQLLRDGGGIARARAGVYEQCALIPEEEVEEGLLVVGAAGFAEDVEVGIVFVDLPIGNLQAVGTAGDPGGREGALLDAGRCGGKQGQRAEKEGEFRHDQNSYRSANCITRASDVLVSSPKVDGVAKLRFGVLKLTWLKTLKASPRMLTR